MLQTKAKSDAIFVSRLLDGAAKTMRAARVIAGWRLRPKLEFPTRGQWGGC
jgi:hypothetical protein